jgi:hypothetical protein
VLGRAGSPSLAQHPFDAAVAGPSVSKASDCFDQRD